MASGGNFLILMLAGWVRIRRNSCWTLYFFFLVSLVFTNG